MGYRGTMTYEMRWFYRNATGRLPGRIDGGSQPGEAGDWPESTGSILSQAAKCMQAALASSI